MPEEEPVLRKLHCQVGLISRADGSAQLSQGGTSVIAGTYGPVEVKPHKELPGLIKFKFWKLHLIPTSFFCVSPFSDFFI